MMERFGYPAEYLGQKRALSEAISLLFYPMHMAGVLAFNPGRAWAMVRSAARA
jgi:omega-hydroxy-beta-dihydromenaquinone-9 sulfotransferase